MRRDSIRARQLAAATTTPARTLEGWSHAVDGIAFLGPEQSPDDEALVGALRAVGTEGRDRVSVALNVASRFGLAVYDYKTALRRVLQLDDPDVRELTTPLDIDADGSLSDEGAVEAERRATIVEAALDPGVRARFAEAAADYEEPQEALRQSWATLIAASAAGATPYYTPAGPALLGIDAEDAGRFQSVIADGMEARSFDLNRVGQILNDTPASDLAAVAPQLAPLVQVTARSFGVSYDPNRDETAATFVPVLLAIGSEAIEGFVAASELLGPRLAEGSCELL